jgi:hypothetical protein
MFGLGMGGWNILGMTCWRLFGCASVNRGVVMCGTTAALYRCEFGLQDFFVTEEAS